ncbi:hypothetical protein GCM10012280_25430 [Wenjunlia tyrosinilytica]|uniref:Uncharacterized protein n=1 Tax=Wenjunlia tyrosinilytica TaxID=1544741 RepID=A0A917ZMK4_9ACTN|nr:hypothetical protein GCM10012280_25430 [Wenjunlia tyrosinilytica]
MLTWHGGAGRSGRGNGVRRERRRDRTAGRDGPSGHSTQAGGHAAQVYCPPLGENRLSLHATDRRESAREVSGVFQDSRQNRPYGGNKITKTPHRTVSEAFVERAGG